MELTISVRDQRGHDVAVMIRFLVERSSLLLHRGSDPRPDLEILRIRHIGTVQTEEWRYLVHQHKNQIHRTSLSSPVP